MKVAGFEIVADPRVPRGEIHFIKNQILVGRIIGINWEIYMSTTWKSLLAGFAAGVVSTAVFFGLEWHRFGIALWLASLAYLGYQVLEARHSE